MFLVWEFAQELNSIDVRSLLRIGCRRLDEFEEFVVKNLIAFGSDLLQSSDCFRRDQEGTHAEFFEDLGEITGVIFKDLMRRVHVHFFRALVFFSCQHALFAHIRAVWIIFFLVSGEDKPMRN